MRSLGTRRLVIIGLAAICVLGIAAPIVAFGVVPLFVRRTVHEDLPRRPVAGAAETPSESAGAPATTLEPAPRVLLSGLLRKVDPVHFGTGEVSVVDVAGAHYLRFESVAIAGAPNMYVYLSDRTDGQPGTFIDLGPLKATDGSFNYELPAGTDLSPVRSLVVWCRAFAVTVTFAELLPPVAP